MSRPRVAGAFFALATSYGLLLFGYRYLEHVAYHDGVSPLGPLVDEMTGVWTALPLVPPFLWLVRRFPLDRARWARHAPFYVLAMIAMSLAHTTMMAVSRALIWPLVGLGAYHYGDMRVRYPMEMANDAISFCMFVAVVSGIDALRAARERDLAQARLREELARTQLQALERRLHPHFLFNALNTISAVMYEDPAAADRMISGLSELLRRALQAGDAQEVPLADELALLECYLDIMRVRFEDRLVVELDVQHDVQNALVPPLLLQPLVENAIRHGADPASHMVKAALRARRSGASLCLEVRDHGRGLAGGAGPAEGVGLSTTARRLATLYGDAHALAFENADDGGLRVTIRLPFRMHPDARAAG